MRPRRFVLALAITASTTAAAQPGDAASVCWRPRPAVQCRSWLITETALEMPASSTSAFHRLVGYPNGEGYVSADFETRLAFTIGGMMNRGPKHAFGATATMLSTDFPGRVEARYRRWLYPETGIDLSAGYTRGIVRGTFDPDELTARGFTTSIGISGTYLGADARLDVMRTSAGRIVRGTYVSVRAGSRAGPITTAAGFVLFMGAFALLVGDDY